MFTATPAAACTRRGISLHAATLAIALSAIACHRSDVPPRDEDAVRPPARLEVAAAPRASAPRPSQPAAPANPLAAITPEKQTITGRIEERLVAGSYVYLAVRGRDDALRWAVVMGDAPVEGADVVLTSMGRRPGFRSARLGREFDELHFALLADAPTS
jgi:hypothetical protein